KRHATDRAGVFLGQLRTSVRRMFMGAAGCTARRVATLKPALERLEDRQVLAAAFFAPAEPAGSVNVQLVPLANVVAGTQEIVTFGLPFTRGSVSPSQLSQVRVLKNGTGIPAFAGKLTPWRGPGDAP